MLRLLLACWAVVALLSCDDVPPECTQLEPELTFELGFARYEREVRSIEEWRADLSSVLDDVFDYSTTLANNEPVLVGESFLDGIRLREYEMASDGDQATIPFVIAAPPRSFDLGENHVVMVLHGHGETIAAPFDPDTEMKNIGGELLDLGYVVVSVEMRSFGTFLVKGEGHRAYIQDLESGEYVGRVVDDNVQVARAVARLYEDEGYESLTVLGHSFGGYVALHIGALFDEVDRTMSSGHFAPYACVNTDFHDACQDVLEADGRFEIYDTVGLISPRFVDLFYNTGDGFYTPAADEGFERLTAIYEKTGAPGNATFTVTPGLGHEVPVEAVLERLPPLDEN